MVTEGRSLSATPIGVVLVLGSLGALLVIRFFTEVVGVLPQGATFIDIPITALLVIAALMVPANGPSALRTWPAPLIAVALFLAVATVSAMLHVDRVDAVPAFVFLYGFLSPLVVYVAVFRLWPGGHAQTTAHFLVGVGIVQFVVVALLQLPVFLGNGNPDEISGTFGENAYQLVFFLNVFNALVIGAALFQPRRWTGRLAPLLLLASALVIFLAQYRALLLTTFLSLVLVGVLVSVVRRRALLLTLLALVTLVGAYYAISSVFPENRLNEGTTALQEDPWFFVEARLSPMEKLGELYTDPAQAIAGTGPGTFSSRAWRTFAIAEGRPALAGRYPELLPGGRYRTDVSEKLIVPQLREAEVVEGSFLVTSPLSSYLSLFAEVGVLGALALLGVYVLAALRSARLTLARLRERRRDDALPALLLASTIALVVLLQMGFLDNWLEVTRVTFLSWALFAIASKEVLTSART